MTIDEIRNLRRGNEVWLKGKIGLDGRAPRFRVWNDPSELGGVLTVELRQGMQRYTITRDNASQFTAREPALRTRQAGRRRREG